MSRRSLLAVGSIAVLVMIAWFALGGRRPYPITNASPRGTNIIAFGDSLTAGNGAPPGENYVDQLSKSLGVPIINAGVSGNTTLDALNRFDRDVLERDPKIVIVLLGGNDVIRRLPAQESATRIDEITRRIQERGALVVLVAFNMGGGDLATAVEKIAAERGCPFVPNILGGVIGNADLMTDAVHPNAKGYAIVAKRIETAVRPYVHPESKP